MRELAGLVGRTRRDLGHERGHLQLQADVYVLDDRSKISGNGPVTDLVNTRN